MFPTSLLLPSSKPTTLLSKPVKSRPAQGLGLRPHPKKNNHLREKGPILWLKSQIFIKLYIYIYIFLFIFLKLCIFYFICDVKDIINFTINLQIVMLLITKKWFKHLLIKLMNFINESQCHIILWTFYSVFSMYKTSRTLIQLKPQNVSKKKCYKCVKSSIID